MKGVWGRGSGGMWEGDGVRCRMGRGGYGMRKCGVRDGSGGKQEEKERGEGRA